MKKSYIKSVSFFLLICFIFTSCHKKTKKPIDIKIPVATSLSKQMDAPIYIENIGHVEAFIKVDIRSRIEGELENINFKEGSDVNIGDLLFVVDPKNYIATLQKANATLAENKATLSLAKDTLTRNAPLYKKEYISELYFDNLITNVKKYDAIIDQNQADVEKATTNLDYCYIHSPINGKIGILNIDLGNLISQDGAESLTTITQVQPIYVTFLVPQNELYLIKKYQKNQPYLKTLVSHDNFESKENDIEGELNIINNEIDEKSANIKLKAVFKNSDNLLTPGEFVKTRLILTIQKKAIIVPFQAIQITPNGKVVFVEKNGRVEMRKVKLGNRFDNNIIVLSGVNANEKVVIKGQINLVDGSSVFELKE
ncbi:MAG: Multidrug resistance protein MdtA [Candidatus Anoxychlamydiales bacterium]|nr:Multidrug resistance protein MdtA [Candidatus Anoxychlamydiales bacterium]